MKRMVKNGDLLDISEDGSGVTFGGNLKVGGTIIANGEIRGGDVSASKFYLGTEEMPLVKANPAGDATGTLEKIKIGNVAYKVGGGSGDRELILTVPYPRSTLSSDRKITVDEETWNKVKDCYYETIKINYNDGYPLGVFHVFYYEDYSTNLKSKQYACVAYPNSSLVQDDWYGKYQTGWFAKIDTRISDITKYIWIHQFVPYNIPNLDKSKFDALYKLADKPTQDGTYVLKATVSGGAVTYTWEPQA